MDAMCLDVRGGGCSLDGDVFGSDDEVFGATIRQQVSPVRRSEARAIDIPSAETSKAGGRREDLDPCYMTYNASVNRVIDFAPEEVDVVLRCLTQFQSSVPYSPGHRSPLVAALLQYSGIPTAVKTPSVLVKELHSDVRIGFQKWVGPVWNFLYKKSSAEDLAELELPALDRAVTASKAFPVCEGFRAIFDAQDELYGALSWLEEKGSTLPYTPRQAKCFTRFSGEFGKLEEACSSMACVMSRDPDGGRTLQEFFEEAFKLLESAKRGMNADGAAPTEDVEAHETGGLDLLFETDMEKSVSLFGKEIDSANFGEVLASVEKIIDWLKSVQSEINRGVESVQKTGLVAGEASEALRLLGETRANTPCIEMCAKVRRASTSSLGRPLAERMEAAVTAPLEQLNMGGDEEVRGRTWLVKPATRAKSVGITGNPRESGFQ